MFLSRESHGTSRSRYRLPATGYRLQSAARAYRDGDAGALRALSLWRVSHQTAIQLSTIWMRISVVNTAG